MTSPYITHITLTTGHMRRSPRDEVGDDTLRALHPWLTDLIASGERRPLPVPALAQYSVNATVEGGGLVATIWAPRGPHVPSHPHFGEVDPVATLGIAQRSRHGPDLWALMLAHLGGKSGLKRPAEPWCAVALHPAMAAHRDSAALIGDLERCIAWAWITRAPSLGTV